MKKLLFALIALLIALVFSCDKSEDQITATPQHEDQSIPMPTLAELQRAPTLPGEPLEKSPTVSLINEDHTYLKPNQGYSFFIRREHLGDPLFKKHEVVVTNRTPSTGNPDLYIFGYNSRTRASRLIRRSRNAPRLDEVMSFRSTDLSSTEDLVLVFIIVRENPAKISVFTSIRSVDCVEYPVYAARVVSQGIPVRGCDGVLYENATFAFAAGITSWYESIVN